MPDKPKWTPGPWTYAPIPGYQYVVEIRKAEQIFLCAGAVPPGREDEIMANATLAAAAPSLYEELDAAMRLLREVWRDNPNHPIWKTGPAALLKARGEG